MDTPRISIIVAADKNRGIGKTTLGVGKLLWHIPDDMKRFKELTMGHAVIMGRKTFESVLSYLKKPFPGRTSIVVTRDQKFAFRHPKLSSSRKRGSEKRQSGLSRFWINQIDARWIPDQVGNDNLIICGSLEEALNEAKKVEKEEIFIIGGGQIYEQTLPFADRLYLTFVEGEYDADTFFPDYSDFKKILSREDKETAKGLKFSWLTLER